MKFTFLFLFFSFSAPIFADCNVRVYVDPIYSNQVTKAMEKALKLKKYKVISHADERWEHFRLHITSPGIAPEGQVAEVVSVGLQKFLSPNFEYIYQRAIPLGAGNRNERAMEYLKEIPSCPQAIYAEVFTSLKD